MGRPEISTKCPKKVTVGGETRVRSDASPLQTIVPTYALREGARVTILATDNVMHRFPHLIDTIGRIKEAPVHPATWFKVIFEDGTVSTFRPSALMPLDDNDIHLYPLAAPNAPAKEAKKIEREKATRRERSNSTSGVGSDTEKHLRRQDSNSTTSTTNRHNSSNLPAEPLLSTLDQDSWPGSKVYIAGGRYEGVTGTVLSSGSGWVQLETNIAGEISKRAHELRVTEMAAATNPVSSPLIKNERRKAGNTKENSKKLKEHRRPRACSTSDEDEKPFTKARPRPRMDSLTSDDGQPLRPRRIVHVHHTALLEPKPHPQPLTSKHAAFIARKRSCVNNYVERESQKFRRRPNLADWKHKIDRMLDDHSAGCEEQAATNAEFSYCKFCYVEKSQEAPSCLNEHCFASPAFQGLHSETNTMIISPLTLAAAAARRYQHISTATVAEAAAAGRPIPREKTLYQIPYHQYNFPSSSSSSSSAYNDILPHSVATFLRRTPAIILPHNQKKPSKSSNEQQQQHQKCFTGPPQAPASLTHLTWKNAPKESNYYSLVNGPAQNGAGKAATVVVPATDDIQSEEGGQPEGQNRDRVVSFSAEEDEAGLKPKKQKMGHEQTDSLGDSSPPVIAIGPPKIPVSTSASSNGVVANISPPLEAASGFGGAPPSTFTLPPPVYSPTAKSAKELYLENASSLVKTSKLLLPTDSNLVDLCITTAR